MDDYDILSNLENSLRKLIEDELSKLTSKWWKQRIPDDVKENSREKKETDQQRGYQQTENHPLISYVDFGDYEKIIIRNDNWEDVFKNIFRDKNAISVKLKELEPIRRAIGHSRKLSKEDKKRLRFYSQEIISAIKYYKDQADLKKMQKRFQISVSSDRTVYPTDSIVHVQVNLPEIIPNEIIRIKVLDPSNKVLVTKEIDPNAQPAEQQASNIFETIYEMKGDDWKVGNTYTVIANYGPSEEAADSYLIDERMPALQSDKSVYEWGDDMILTIIDPDADKDNDKAEIAGDRQDSKLIIKSSKKTLENYRLRETGDSTGIFQGIVGFIGVEDNGTIHGYDLEGKTVTSTQGHEIDDGFIEVGEREEMTITYTNRVGTAYLTVFVIRPPEENVE